MLRIQSEVKMSKLFNKLLKKNLIIRITPRTGAKKNVSYRLPSLDEKNLFTQTKVNKVKTSTLLVGLGFYLPTTAFMRIFYFFYAQAG